MSTILVVDDDPHIRELVVVFADNITPVWKEVIYHSPTGGGSGS